MKQNMKKIISILCMIVIMLVGLSGCQSGLQGGQPEAEVISNDGLAIAQGDWIYYINGGMPANLSASLSETDQAAIWRMKADGTQKERVSKKKAFDFHIYEGKIFFITPYSSGLDVYSVNIDGTHEKRITSFQDQNFYDFGDKGMAVENAEKIIYIDYETSKTNSIDAGDVVQILVQGDYIYYYMLNVAGMFRVNIDGTGLENLSSTVGFILYTDNQVMYFTFNGVTLYKVDINTLELTKITNSEYTDMQVNYEKNVMIATDTTEEYMGLYVMPLDGTGVRSRIYSKEVGVYYPGEDYIFFTDKADGILYRVNYNGTEKTELCTITPAEDFGLDQVGDKLFIVDTTTPAKSYYILINGGELIPLEEEATAT